MNNDEVVETIPKKDERISVVLDKRVWAKAEALGYGEQSIVANAAELYRMTLHSEKTGTGQSGPVCSGDRIRKVGGGRKKLTGLEPMQLSALEGLVEPTTRRDSENPLRWTCLSTCQLAAALEPQGYRIGRRTVAGL